MDVEGVFYGFSWGISIVDIWRVKYVSDWWKFLFQVDKSLNCPGADGQLHFTVVH